MAGAGDTKGELWRKEGDIKRSDLSLKKTFINIFWTNFEAILWKFYFNYYLSLNFQLLTTNF